MHLVVYFNLVNFFIDKIDHSVHFSICLLITFLILNGDKDNRLEGNLNITFPKYSAEKIMMKLSQIACSTGSACSSSTPTPSHVLQALNLNKQQINNTIRFGIGKFNTEEEMKEVVKMFEKKLKDS